MTMLGKVCTASVVLLAAVLAGCCAARVPGNGEGTTSRQAWTHDASRLLGGLTGKELGKGRLHPVPLGPTPLYLDDGAAERQLEPAEVYERILNGDTVDPLDRAPYVALLILSFLDGDSLVCSGVVVAQDIVLLAASCLDFTASDRKVCAGLNKRSPGTLARKCFPVRSIEVHDAYLQGFQFVNDIAAVRVRGNLQKVGAKIAKVSFQRRFRQRIGTEGFLRGWGGPNNDFTGAEELQETDVLLYGARGELLRGIEEQMCQGSCLVNFESFDLAWGDFDGSRGGGCAGDAGGPVVVQNHTGDIGFGKYVVVGVASFAFETEGRCLTTPGMFFTKFSYTPIRKFVKSTVSKWGRKLRIVQ